MEVGLVFSASTWDCALDVRRCLQKIQLPSKSLASISKHRLPQMKRGSQLRVEHRSGEWLTRVGRGLGKDHRIVQGLQNVPGAAAAVVDPDVWVCPGDGFAIGRSPRFSTPRCLA